MNLPVLDIFILSLIDRGCSTAYDLHRQARLSLGGSLPSLSRLLKGGYVTMTKGRSSTKRQRHEYELTSEGRKAARQEWKPILVSDAVVTDIDTVLRIADMAAYYGTPPGKISRFLHRVIEDRDTLAKQAAIGVEGRSTKAKTYRSMRLKVDSARLVAEIQALSQLANSFRRSKPAVPGQRLLVEPTETV